MSGSRRALLVALTVLWSCTSTQTASELESGTGEIVVIAYTGLSRPEGPLLAPPVSLIADVTSLAEPNGRIEASAEDQLALARRMARELLPERSGAVSLVPFDRLGERPTSECAAPRGAWAASAIDRLRLQREGGEAPARAVLVADIARECEPDLCRAGRDLVDTGVWLDVVSMGSTLPPPCLRGLRPAASFPGPRVRALTPQAPRFRVERSEIGAERSLLATGVADGRPVRVAAGRVRVVVELDGEESVGPFSVAPGERARVRVQSFPLSARTERSWVVETQLAR